MNKKTVEVKRNYCTCEKICCVSLSSPHTQSDVFTRRRKKGEKAGEGGVVISSLWTPPSPVFRRHFENCRRDRAQFTRSTFFRARHKKGGEAGKGGARRKSPPSPPFTPFHRPFWKSVMDGYAQDHKTVGFCVGKRVKTASTLARTGPPRHFLGCGLTESTALNLRFKLKTLEVT